MSGVYGMNVSEISGSDSNPNIWQFFVAVVAMNVVVLLSLAISNWVHTMRKHGRKAGVREILGFAVGRISTK
jgi:Mg2+ and Co2+ transporter CorA